MTSHTFTSASHPGGAMTENDLFAGNPLNANGALRVRDVGLVVEVLTVSAGLAGPANLDIIEVGELIDWLISWRAALGTTPDAGTQGSASD